MCSPRPGQRLPERGADQREKDRRLHAACVRRHGARSGRWPWTDDITVPSPGLDGTLLSQALLTPGIFLRSEAWSIHPTYGDCTRGAAPELRFRGGLNLLRRNSLRSRLDEHLPLALRLPFYPLHAF